MSKSKPKLKTSWRRFHVLIWLLGLAILAWGKWWWPGILLVVAASILYQVILQKYIPQAFEEPFTQPPASPLVTEPAIPPSPQTQEVIPLAAQATNAIERRLELLPSVCAKCGGPIRSHEVTWTGPQSADCPYCGANLPMEWGKQPG